MPSVQQRVTSAVKPSWLFLATGLPTMATPTTSPSFATAIEQMWPTGLGGYEYPPEAPEPPAEPPEPPTGRDVKVLATPEQVKRIEALTSEDDDEQAEMIAAAVEPDGQG